MKAPRKNTSEKTTLLAGNFLRRRTGGTRFRWFDFSRKGWIRLLLVAVAAWLFFGYVARPVYIDGGSMLPTYSDRGVNFCWMPIFWFRSPHRGQIVIARYAGERVMLLKRVVALAGEEVEFRDGQLLVNGKEVKESYVALPCNWNLPPRRVDDGYVYVVGDNRSMPIENHKFGQLAVNRIVGVPLW